METHHPAGSPTLELRGSAKRLLNSPENFDNPIDPSADEYFPHVVVIALSGNFVGHNAKTPPGAADPTGNRMYIIYTDTTDYKYAGWAIGDAAS